MTNMRGRLPGLIDSHTHMTGGLGPNAIVEAVTGGAVDAAVYSKHIGGAPDGSRR